MTFNVRYGTAPDGAEAWPARRQLALGVLRAAHPDLIGLQEALRFQLDEIRHTFPDWGEVGVGRDDGVTAGEYAAILYDKRRFRLLEHGHFWLSGAPDRPGSMTWGNRFPRIVTWARLFDGADGTSFLFLDTHWDHESQPARERGAALMRERIRALARPGEPVLVTGDFNCGPDNPARRALQAAGLADTFDPSGTVPAGTGQGTYHAFRGDRSGPRIDAILISPAWAITAPASAITSTDEQGLYPSDHFPVTATIVRRATAVSGAASETK